MNFHSLESATARRDYEPNRPAQALAADDCRAQILERRLLLTFVLVATITILWQLGTGLQWVWANCVSQLHSAVIEAGIW